MISLTKHELKRWLTAPILWGITLIAASMTAFSAIGNGVTLSETFATGDEAIRNFSDIVIGLMISPALATALLAAYIVTSDFSSNFTHFIKASQPNVVTWIAAKAISAIVGGFIVLTSTYWLTIFVAHIFLKSKGYTFSPTDSVGEYYWRLSLGFIFLSLLGVALGFIVRRTSIALVIAIAFSMAFETVIGVLSEKVYLWFPQGALSSIAKEPTTAEPMTLLQSVGVFCLWAGVGLILAFISAKRPLDVGSRLLKKNTN